MKNILIKQVNKILKTSTNRMSIQASKKTIFIIIYAVVMVFGFSISYHFYNKYQQLRNNPEIAIQNETRDLVDKVGKIIELPEDETPTVMIVQDKGKLKGETFFENAENGDIAMMFSKAMKAILYRPSINKIIEVGLFMAQPAATSTISNATSTNKATVTIRNGTTITGLANLVAKKIILNEDIKIAFVGNAVKHTYEKTVVIDITGGNTLIVSEIVKNLGAAIGELPADESKSTSDILIIAGKDMKSL